MKIHLPKDLEQIVRNAMQTGGFPGEEAVIRAALTRLLESLASPTKSPKCPTKAIRNADTATPPVTRDEIHRRLLATGLVAQLPDSAVDCDDDDEPVEIMGEPLSETIIRERR